MESSLFKKFALACFLVNLTAIIFGVASGYHRGRLAYRFEEKQAITYFSSNQLAVTAFVGWMTYLVRRKLLRNGPAQRRSNLFWAISALGFFYLMLDESFQIHEGMDKSFAGFMGARGDPMLDGVVTGAYGLVAAAICYYFRAEILRYRGAVKFFCLGGVFLFITSVLDLGEETALQIVFEESAKLLGVASFLVGHLAALVGTLEDVEQVLASETASRKAS